MIQNPGDGGDIVTVVCFVNSSLDFILTHIKTRKLLKYEMSECALYLLRENILF